MCSIRGSGDKDGEVSESGVIISVDETMSERAIVHSDVDKHGEVVKGKGILILFSFIFYYY